MSVYEKGMRGKCMKNKEGNLLYCFWRYWDPHSSSIRERIFWEKLFAEGMHVSSTILRRASRLKLLKCLKRSCNFLSFHIKHITARSQNSYQLSIIFVLDVSWNIKGLWTQEPKGGLKLSNFPAWQLVRTQYVRTWRMPAKREVSSSKSGQQFIILFYSKKVWSFFPLSFSTTLVDAPRPQKKA